MKRLICTAFTALILSSNFAVADNGFSLGVSAVRADIDVNDVGINVNGDATGWRLFGLYKFNDKFGIEGGVSSFDGPDDPTIPSNFEVEHESFDLFAVGNLPVTEKLDLYGKLGFVSSTTEVEEDELSEVSSSSTDLALGLGAEYELSNRFAIRTEFQWSDSQNSGAVTMLSFGGVYRFQ